MTRAILKLGKMFHILDVSNPLMIIFSDQPLNNINFRTLLIITISIKCVCAKWIASTNEQITYIMIWT